MAKNNDTCYKFPNCEGCTDKNCSIHNCIHTDNKETLHNVLKRIEDLEKEKCELLGIIQGKDTVIQDLQKENTEPKQINSETIAQLNLDNGESPQKANRKFSIITENHIIFKPTKKEHFLLEINTSKTYQKYLIGLSELAEQKKIPIDFKLDLEYIYISFDLNKLKSERKVTPKIKDRYFSIDMNPNYVGYTVIDWIDGKNYKIVDKGCFSLKDLNNYDDSLKGKGFSPDSKERKYISNKRNFEVINIAHKLVKIAEHYQCETFAMEDLSIKSKDNKKGSKFNKLCNQQWCRTIFINQIKKICKLYKIQILEVISNYSSFIGNLLYRKEKLPDFVLASIEISRRGYEFNHQYILKDKEQKKNIVYGNFDEDKEVYIQSLEELNIDIQFSSFQELYDKIKKSKVRYRFPLDSCNYAVFRKNSIKNYQTLYKFV